MEQRKKNLQDVFATSAMLQRMMHAYLHRSFDELGLAPSQLQLLQFIEIEQPVSFKQLAAHMRLTPGAITQLIEGLVQSGYVTRTTGPEDRRVSIVSLTAAGGEKIGKLKRKKQALLEKVVADLDDEELEVYLRVQQKMLEHLEINFRNVKK